MGKSVVKEIFILALLTMVIIFILGILFYDYIPTNRSVPTAIEYVADSKIKEALKSVKYESSTGSSDNTSEKSSLLKSYSIDASDLKNYASQKDYESGKTDPFSDYKEPVTEESNETSTITNTNSSAKSTSTSNTKDTNTTTVKKETVNNSSTSKKETTNSKSVQGETSNSSSGTFFEKAGTK